MPEPVDIGYSFGLPPRQAIEYFKAKGYEISWNWWETWQEANARSFTVAKAAKMDVLADIRSEVERALEEGLTEKQFADALEPRLRAKGWWGRKFVADPDGVIRKAQLGSPRRLKTIYRTNMRVAQAVSAHRFQMETADFNPYWQYLTLDDNLVRDSHRALHGRVFRYDDPIWQIIYPPNGWG